MTIKPIEKFKKEKFLFLFVCLVHPEVGGGNIENLMYV